MKANEQHSELEDNYPISLPQNENRAKWIPSLAALLLIIGVFFVFHGSRAKSNFSTRQWEDQAFMQHNAANIHSLMDCFTKRPQWPGLYRPLTTNLYFFIGRTLFNDKIEIYHSINIVFYITNAFLLYIICLNFFPRFWPALPAILFVSRLSHAEVACNTCEFQGLLSVFFTLIALKLFLIYRLRQSRWMGGLSTLSFALAMLSKETAIMYPALLIAMGWFFDDRRAWSKYLDPVLAAAVWAMLFVSVFRGISDYESSGISFDMSLTNVVRNYAAYALVFFNVLVYPLENIVMEPGIAKLAGTIPVIIAFIMITITVGAFAVIHRGYRNTGYLAAARLPAFGFAWFIIGISPYIVLDSRLFMRYGYFGHAGLAICCTVVINEIMKTASSARRRHRKRPL